ncbi:MAG: DMT family transporter [Candidatus Hodarchaeales archaeon]|jgi:drug/metabolite transporter (DMT)-like permease
MKDFSSISAKSSIRYDYLALIIATIAVSGASIFIRYALKSSAPIIIAFWRLFLVVLLLTPLLLFSEMRKQFRSVLTFHHMKYFVLGGFFLSLHFFSWIQSLEYTSVAASVIVVNSSPLWVVFLSFILFREVISPYQVIGLILCFAGIILIAFGDAQNQLFESFQEGVILALFGSLMVACYFIIGKRMRSQFEVSNISYTYFVNGSCTIFLFLYSLGLSEQVWVFPLSNMTWFLALAIGPSLLGHALYTYSMKKLSAQVVSLTVLGEAAGASILGFIFLSEHLPISTILGGVFIGIGIILAVLNEE